jgi:hypothetical protein
MSVVVLGFAANKLAVAIGGAIFIVFIIHGYLSARKNPNIPHKRAFPISVAFCVLFVIARVVIAWR